MLYLWVSAEWQDVYAEFGVSAEVACLSYFRISAGGIWERRPCRIWAGTAGALN
jgi:hypothetical protein